VTANGSSGPLTGRELLVLLERAELSGTLFLAQGARGALLLLQAGRLAAHCELGEPLDLDSPELRFALSPHGPAPLPQLPPRYPEARLGLLRALPALSQEPPKRTPETDVRALLLRLSEERFCGGVVGRTSEGQESLLLFHHGRLGAAVAEEGERVRGGSAALRALLQGTEVELTLHLLPGLLSSSLLGLSLGLSVEREGIFSGLEVSGAGYTFYRAGQAYLHLPGEPLQTPGLFALCQHAPHLTLPSEPPGWERQRYGLTLRGRDALDPMTELSMRFRSEFGRAGLRALELFRRGASAEDAAEDLELELGDFRGYVERLEAESFIRRVS